MVAWLFSIKSKYSISNIFVIISSLTMIYFKTVINACGLKFIVNRRIWWKFFKLFLNRLKPFFFQQALFLFIFSFFQAFSIWVLGQPNSGFILVLSLSEIPDLGKKIKVNNFILLRPWYTRHCHLPVTTFTEQ